MKNNKQTLISIVLPTYNRAPFIEKAIRCIKAQTYKCWQLIIIDDGSTDNTQTVVEDIQKKHEQEIIYLKQINQGPAGARNTGLKHISGELVAFYDSDDEWLPHHLNDCINALENNQEIDWVYAACKRVNLETGDILTESTFHEKGEKKPFFQLKTTLNNNVNIITDPKAALCQITYGLDSGLQNSVIRRSVFDNSFIPEFRIGEDRLFILLTIKAGFTFAYIDNVHVLYNVHHGNTSDTAVNDTRYDKRIDSMLKLLTCLNATTQYVDLNSEESRALNQQLADDYFWKLGYSLQWAGGDRRSALKSFLTAIKLQPFNLKFWKTLIFSLIKIILKSK